MYSVDSSAAIDVNRRNNLAYNTRLHLAQASIYELPFADNSFDRVFCFGMLQHTPSFADSIAALVRKTRVNGQIIVDFYPLNGWYTKIHSKYFLRPITKRLSKRLLLKLIESNIGWLLVFFDTLCALKLGALTRFIPITDVRGFPDGLSKMQRREWAVMDTFDGLTPMYDNPQRLKDVIQMFVTHNCEILYAGMINYGSGSSMTVRAQKRDSTTKHLD